MIVSKFKILEEYDKIKYFPDLSCKGIPQLSIFYRIVVLLLAKSNFSSNQFLNFLQLFIAFLIFLVFRTIYLRENILSLFNSFLKDINKI